MYWEWPGVKTGLKRCGLDLIADSTPQLPSPCCICIDCGKTGEIMAFTHRDLQIKIKKCHFDYFNYS